MAASDRDPRHEPLAPLRHRSFRLFVAARFFSGAGATLFQAAIAWHVYELTGSAFQLGALGLVRFVPAVALSLVGGALADAVDRRRILLAAQGVVLACALALFASTERGVLGIAGLYAAVLAVGIALAFERPAGAAILPSLVPRPLFPSAVTVSSLVRAAAFASGPALCGFVIGWAGIGWVYATHALLLVCSLALLAFVRARPIEEPGRRRVDLQAIREGLSFLRRRRAVLGAMTLDMLAVILGGVQVLLPIYASDILEVGPRGYGLLSSSLELGQLLTSVALVLLPPIERVGRALLLSVAGYGLATIAFGLSRSFPLSIAAYMAVGMADQVSVVARTTLIQLATPDALRGRVNAVNLVFIGASNQLGAVEAGFVAALTTAPFAVVSGGVGCLLALLAVIRVAPELGRHVESSGAAGEA